MPPPPIGLLDQVIGVGRGELPSAGLARRAEPGPRPGRRCRRPGRRRRSRGSGSAESSPRTTSTTATTIALSPAAIRSPSLSRARSTRRPLTFVPLVLPRSSRSQEVGLTSITKCSRESSRSSGSENGTSDDRPTANEPWASNAPFQPRVRAGRDPQDDLHRTLRDGRSTVTESLYRNGGAGHIRRVSAEGRQDDGGRSGTEATGNWTEDCNRRLNRLPSASSVVPPPTARRRLLEPAEVDLAGAEDRDRVDLEEVVGRRGPRAGAARPPGAGGRPPRASRSSRACKGRRAARRASGRAGRSRPRTGSAVPSASRIADSTPMCGTISPPIFENRLSRSVIRRNPSSSR